MLKLESNAKAQYCNNEMLSLHDYLCMQLKVKSLNLNETVIYVFSNQKDLFFREGTWNHDCHLAMVRFHISYDNV
jgi:hypothetical protein